MNHSRPFLCLGSSRLCIRSHMFININMNYVSPDQPLCPSSAHVGEGIADSGSVGSYEFKWIICQ